MGEIIIMKLSRVLKLSFCVVLIFQSCTSDYSKKLGSGYFYRDEGGDIKEIFCEFPNGGTIPATVVEFAYNGDFIIAKQRPKIPQDPLYSIDYKYKNGNGDVYFWLIIKESHFVCGPLNIDEFNEARNRYNVPEKLAFN